MVAGEEFTRVKLGDYSATPSAVPPNERKNYITKDRPEIDEQLEGLSLRSSQLVSAAHEVAERYDSVMRPAPDSSIPEAPPLNTQTKVGMVLAQVLKNMNAIDEILRSMLDRCEL